MEKLVEAVFASCVWWLGCAHLLLHLLLLFLLLLLLCQSMSNFPLLCWLVPLTIPGSQTLKIYIKCIVVLLPERDNLEKYQID